MQIAYKEFPIPDLPPPPPAPGTRLLSSLEPEASSQEANKENAPLDEQTKEKGTDENKADDGENAKDEKPLQPGELPPQIASMLADIKAHLEGFATHAPHTIQRLAELVLKPRGHYRALATYLHAVDRVVRVTSATDTYPLPPPLPNLTVANGDSASERDPASDVAWSNPTTAALGTDEALGGALLTPIPWLAREAASDAAPADEMDDEEHETNGSAAEAATEPGAQIHSEATETIDGPNGAGSIETVSVSVNGVPSTGHHTRGVTQGELLRQEQRAGVVPVNQTLGHQPAASAEGEQEGENPPAEESNATVDGEEPVEDEDTPHARGPDEIGVDDTGLQGESTSFIAEDGVLTHGIDVEAAVGRRRDPPQEADTDAESGTKREADTQLESETAKKVKEDEDVPPKNDDSAMDDGA